MATSRLFNTAAPNCLRVTISQCSHRSVASSLSCYKQMSGSTTAVSMKQPTGSTAVVTDSAYLLETPTIPGIFRAPMDARNPIPAGATGKYRVPLPPRNHPMSNYVNPKLDFLAPLIGTLCFIGPFLIFIHFI
ncbi:hypothetical protein IE077_002090 [Cardiosporidium cionae]|uniref:Uncharacterized protein n=1 Tax=Cardiosporidium cionae TaxID=476202 RepID=A0ABQ7JBK9_9APIC|nr:hypothetical protein IE077_002090 [Cardiosporidium cionae]|eukprot:KAF8821387.1 hypothetical protein IE077_002090 [Cardiosporidium cionae]